MLEAQERAGEVDVDLAAVGVGVLVGERAEGGELAGVVEGNETPVAFHGGLDEVFDLCFVGDVGAVEARLASGVTDGLGGGFSFRLAAAGEDDGRAGRGEGAGGGLADAGGGAGDDGHVLSEDAHEVLLGVGGGGGRRR